MAWDLFCAKPLSKPMLGYLTIGQLGTNFSEIRIKIQNITFTKMHPPPPPPPQKKSVCVCVWGGGGGGVKTIQSSTDTKDAFINDCHVTHTRIGEMYDTWFR